MNFSIDRGGTFTDIYAESEGKFYIEKLLSVDPENYEDAPREGIRRLLEKVHGIDLNTLTDSSSYIKWIRMGTTVATNALLERQGAKTALLITKGFADLLDIGYQNRPELFDLNIKKTKMLYEAVIEVDERIAVEGDEFKVVQAVDEVALLKQL